MKKATIRDVAKAAGVSQSTVSRVLNNHPDVSEKARKTIMAVVEKPAAAWKKPWKRCIIRPALLQCVFPKAVRA